MMEEKELSQSIAELIRLHDDVLARIFALQTLLEDLEVLSPKQVQQRTDELRKQFAADLEARFAAHQEKTNAAEIHLVPGMDTRAIAVGGKSNQARSGRNATCKRKFWNQPRNLD
jgi:hypothetical protein